MTENKDLKKIIYSLHPLERKVLPYVELEDIAKIAKASNLTEAETVTAVQLLEQKGYAEYKKEEKIIIGLDKFGEKFANSNLPEITFLNEILKHPKKQSEIKLGIEEISSALGILKRNNLIEISKKDNEMFFTAKNETAEKYLKENSENPLKLFKLETEKNKLNAKQKDVFENLKQRKLIKEFTSKTFSASLTKPAEKIANEIKVKYSKLDLIETLESDMLKSGSFQGKEFRHYDVNVDTPISDLGRRHPMLEANKILKEIFVEMGFKEMQGPMVESAFWNMDSMWIPQDHPARDEQDTFYLEGEADIPTILSKEVKLMHEVGLKRTHTTKGDWSEKIAKKRLLRTHSTEATFRKLAQLGEELKKNPKSNINGKYFYVANTFRNEAVDATHLAEFFQGEGFIIGDELSLADLMGFIKEYYAKMGLTQIKFKPTFNPYTEPSMEAHYYDEKMKKWYALINSGIFRPETLKPFGLENKTIIAWGLGASRVAALLARKDSMRDITGATCDFEWLKTRPMMRREVVRKN